MPTFGLLAGTVLVAAAAAAVVFLFVAWPWKAPRRWRNNAAWALGVGTGIYAGCGFVGQWPRWPPTEDRDRFLAILLPLALAVELAAAFVPARWQAWLLRIVVACAAAPILLFNTTYLADLSGPGSAEWSRLQAALILFTLAVLLLGVWIGCARLQARTSELALSTVLAPANLAAAFTVMLSGYYRGGLLGLPMAGAIGGVALASIVAQRFWIATEDDPYSKDPYSKAPDAVGIGLVGLFTVLLVGRFFGSLPTSSALVLLCAPLLAWLAELPPLRGLRPSALWAIRVFVVAVPLVIVLALAQMRFTKASGNLPKSGLWPAEVPAYNPAPCLLAHRIGKGLA